MIKYRGERQGCPQKWTNSTNRDWLNTSGEGISKDVCKYINHKHVLGMISENKLQVIENPRCGKD